jgi:hypothetical protein
MGKTTAIYFLVLISAFTYAQHVAKLTLPINTFTKISKGIDTICGTQLYQSKKDKAAHRYTIITVDHGQNPNITDDLAFIKIGNKLEKLIQYKYTDIKSIKSIAVYQNISKSIKLSISTKHINIKENKEEGIVSGTITIETKDGRKSTFNFIGDIGC